MFGSLGFPEIMVILVLALLLFGPKRLPEIGRTLGKALGEFRRSTSDLKRSIQTEMTLEEVGVQQPDRPRRPEVLQDPQTRAAATAPAQTAARQPGAEAEASEPPPPLLTSLDIVEPEASEMQSAAAADQESGEPSAASDQGDGEPTVDADQGTGKPTARDAGS